MRIGRNTDLPLLELGGWEPHLPDAHPAELGSLVRSANDALQFLSGLADNNLIKRVKRVAFGFTSFRNYRIRSLLYAGRPNWDLLPTITPR
jgi:hypothetical protein